MKKLLSVFICMIITFGLLYAQENEDFDNQFLPTFDEEDNSGSLDALQESNEIIAEENERIVQEIEEAEQRKQRERAAKWENKMRLRYLSVGLSAPFNFNTEKASGELYDTPFPLGISAQYTGSFSYTTFKTNLNWDFVKYTSGDKVNFLWTASLGFTPIHNDICFIGIYGTLGLLDEEIEKYSYTSYGASINAMYNFSDRFGLFLNIDATYRGKEKYKGDEEVAPYIPRYLDTWRVCPSIGFFYNFMKG